MSLSIAAEAEVANVVAVDVDAPSIGRTVLHSRCHGRQDAGDLVSVVVSEGSVIGLEF
jgi:hypothetical protein